MFAGHWEIIILVLVMLLLFGSARLPKLMHSLGRSKVAFEQGLRGISKEPTDEEE